MKIRNLLLAGLVVLGFSACNNDDVPGATQDDGSVKGYITLNITNQFQSHMRTKGTPTENGTAVENAITSALIYLCEADGTIKSSVPVSTLNKVDEITYTTGATKVSLGESKVFIVTNPIAGMPTTGNINQVIENVTKAQAETGYSEGSFMMVSANNAVDFTTVGVDVDITSNNTETNPYPVAIDVDRVAVKYEASEKEGGVDVSKIKDEEVSAIFGAGMEYKGLVLINGARKFNIVQNWVNELAGKSGLALSTPLSNYDRETDLASYNSNFYNPIYEFGLATESEMTDLTIGKDVFTTEAVYSLEHRPAVMTVGDTDPILTSGKNVTTGVIYHYVLNGGNTFYTYFGKVYTLDQLKELAAFTGDNETNAPDWGDVSDMRLKGIKVYENGNTYYTYYIKGNQGQNTIGDYNYYGVLRNSVYRLTINSISGLGDDIPGGGGNPTDPTDPPIDDKEAYINVTVNVNPWVINNIGVDL